MRSVMNGPVSPLPGGYPDLQSCRCRLFIIGLERGRKALVQGAVDRRNSQLLDLALVACTCEAGSGGTGDPGARPLSIQRPNRGARPG